MGLWDYAENTTLKVSSIVDFQNTHKFMKHDKVFC